MFVSVSHSYDKTSRLCVETKRCWTLAQDIILEWEQRKEQGREEARLVNLSRQSQDGYEESLVCATKCVGSRLVVDLCSFALCVCFFFLGMQWRFLYTRFFRARCNGVVLVFVLVFVFLSVV